MLIVLPSSESKRPALEHGRPVVIADLSFPALTPLRKHVLDALIATSARPDALRRLFVGPALSGEVARNTGLFEQPVRPALEVYTGQLHQGLDAASMSPAAKRRANRDLVVVSALWGALRPVDRIPSYRLHVCSRLVGMDRLEPAWRELLPDVLGGASGHKGVVLDLRSPGFRALGMPSGMVDRTVTLRVRHEDVTRRIGDVIAKRVRGQVARYLLESGADADDPESLASLLEDGWEVRLDPPMRSLDPWRMTLSVSAEASIPDGS